MTVPKRNISMGSLFDGIGGFPFAAIRAGITPIWASEIEKAPISITKRHFPEMLHLGDITALSGADMEPVDLITFGSPCQDLSLAGNRAGLSGKRSGLFMEAVRIIKEMRDATNGARPAFAIWENVTGAFSSNEGEDFRIVLEELAAITEPGIAIPRCPSTDGWLSAGAVMGDSWSLAWRTLDAQYWGVPQRRRRIFLVADFRGQCAGEVLFKPESLSGDSAESGAEGERATADVAAGFGETGVGYWKEGIQCLRAEGENRPRGGGVHPGSLRSPSVATPPLKVEPGGNQIPAVCIDCRNHAVNEDISGTLQSKDNGGHSLNYINPVAVPFINKSFGEYEQDDVARSLLSSDYKRNTGDLIEANYSVRRLTPMECERLQGFPEILEVNMEMTKDEYIAYNLACNNINVNFETGNVFTSRGGGGRLLPKPRKLKGTDISGYIVYSIRNNEIKKQCRGHRIVWIAANGIPPSGMFIDHINNNKADNRLCNLQLVTPRENSTKAAIDGLYRSGTDNPSSKLQEWQRIEICDEYASGQITLRVLAQKYGVSKSRIHQIVRSAGWTEYGHDNKPISDAQRYKALGNSVAIPCVDFLMTRILAVINRLINEALYE